MLALNFEQRAIERSAGTTGIFEPNEERSFPSAAKPRMTVTTFPLFRLSTVNVAVCFAGDTCLLDASGGGQEHSLSSRSQRSQIGGRSQSVPANSLIIWAFVDVGR